MKRRYLHLMTDGLMALGAVGLILTGLLIAFVLPSGSRAASVWGMTRHDWGDVHFWIAMGILATGLLHLIMNWGWVCSAVGDAMNLKSRKRTLKRKLFSGLATVLAMGLLVGGFLYAADAGKMADPGGDGQGHGRQGQGRGQLEREMQDLFLGEG